MSRNEYYIKENKEQQKRKAALLAKKIISTFLRTKGEKYEGHIEESLYGHATNIDFSQNKEKKISLKTLGDKQNFILSLEHNIGRQVLINTVLGDEATPLGISKYYQTLDEFEKEINIEPFKDLRRKVKSNTANKEQKFLLGLCEEFNILFGIEKDAYELDAHGEMVYEDGEKKLKVKGGSLVLAYTSPSMAISHFEFDKVVMISPDIIKHFWGVSNIGFLNNKGEEFDPKRIVMKLLNFMESNNISDLHMGQSDADSYFFTARQHTKKIDIKDDDGELARYSSTKARNIINQLKNMAGKDTQGADFATNGLISQDLTNGRRNFRLNVFNTVYSNIRGNSFSLRRLSKEDELKSLQELNYMQVAIDLIIAVLEMNVAGLVLISGPTNSGKSTLLAALLVILRDMMNRRVVRMENPIEIDLGDIPTVDFSHYEKEVLTRRDILDEFMRHDPDVTAIGEARKIEELLGALLLADEGHLTLLTNHAKSVEKAIKRFLDIPEVSKSDFNSLLKMNINQHLLLQPCPKCKHLTPIEANGCKKCGGSQAIGVLPVFDLIIYLNVGIYDDILDTQKLIDENKAVGIMKSDVIKYYQDKGLLDENDAIVFLDEKNNAALLEKVSLYKGA